MSAARLDTALNALNALLTDRQRRRVRAMLNKAVCSKSAQVRVNALTAAVELFEDAVVDSLLARAGEPDHGAGRVAAVPPVAPPLGPCRRDYPSTAAKTGG